MSISSKYLSEYWVLVSGTEYSEPVVEADDDEATDDGKYAAVVRVAGTDVVRLAVYENDDCQGSVPILHCRHVTVARVCRTTRTSQCPDTILSSRLNKLIFTVRQTVVRRFGI